MNSQNKITSIIVVILLITSGSIRAQIKNAKSATVKINGNCGMCKTTIEEAAFKKNVAMAVWNEESKTAIITYDSIKSDANMLLKRVALAGYDNENFIAPDDAYTKLPGCCQYARNKQKEIKTAATTDRTEEPKKEDNVSPAEQTTNPLSEVYNAYFSLKDALVKTDGVTAAAKAKALFDAINLVKTENLSEAQQSLWRKQMTLLAFDAEHIKNTTATEHQREHFMKLSSNMIALMKVIKPDYTVYLDNCPMYNNGKGADWLSKETGIRNPYYGNQMLNCGSTKETITK